MVRPEQYLRRLSLSRHHLPFHPPTSLDLRLLHNGMRDLTIRFRGERHRPIPPRKIGGSSARGVHSDARRRRVVCDLFVVLAYLSRKRSCPLWRQTWCWVSGHRRMWDRDEPLECLHQHQSRKGVGIGYRQRFFKQSYSAEYLVTEDRM
jgi:hypothetical protein